MAEAGFVDGRNVRIEERWANLGAKRVQLLRELAPKVSRVGLLMNPDNPNVAAELADSKDGAARLGLQIVVVNARTVAEIDAAFAELMHARIEALISATDPFLLTAASRSRHLPSAMRSRQSRSRASLRWRGCS